MKFTKLFLALIAIMVVMGLSSCSKSEVGTPINPSGTDNELTTATVYTPDLTIPENLDNMPAPTDPPVGDRNTTGPTASNQQDMLNPFARIFRELNLTETQIGQIKVFLKQRDDCMRKLMLLLRESEKAIMEEAIKARREVIAAVKDGTIKRAEAAVKLKEIDMKTRKALVENPVRLKVMVGLKKCEDDFLANVGTILDDAQKAKWDAFVTKYKEMRDKKRPNTTTNG